MYEIRYVPRVQDEMVIATFDNVIDAHVAMTEIKTQKPKAYPHHYILNTKTNKTIEHEDQFDEFGWWGT
jgi:hypothetical protein